MYCLLINIKKAREILLPFNTVKYQLIIVYIESIY